jgi:hypothetical protein
VGNGENTQFWEDTWLGNCQVPLNIGFRHTLTGSRGSIWIHSLQRLMNANLSTQQDVFVWKLPSSGKFTIKSLYLDYMNDHTKFSRKYIWKIKVPLKIRMFSRFLNQKNGNKIQPIQMKLAWFQKMLSL